MSKGTHEPREVLFLPLKISTAVGLLKYNGKPHEGVEVSLNVRKIDFSATKYRPKFEINLKMPWYNHLYHHSIVYSILFTHVIQTREFPRETRKT